MISPSRLFRNSPFGLGACARWILFATSVLVLPRALEARDTKPENLESALSVIRAVGPEGQGNVAAATAWRKLADADFSAVVKILAAMDGANDLALNWLRTAIDAIAARPANGTAALPFADLGTFLQDTHHDPRARRLCFELLTRQDSATTDKLLAGMLNDPSLEIRYDAVQKVMNQAESGAASNKLSATLLYQQALTSARDVDQIETISKRLEEMGQPVDLLKLYGFLPSWKILGPFDNTGQKGFDAVYPPELGIDAGATYDGKSDKVKWRDATTDKTGKLDLNQVCGKLKSVVSYGAADFYSSRAQPAELRLGCATSWKVWFNGKLLFGRDEYHYDSPTEEHSLPVQLQPGRNSILVKICQNELEADWTVDWDFRLRVTDSLGTPFASEPPTKVAANPVPQN